MRIRLSRSWEVICVLKGFVRRKKGSLDDIRCRRMPSGHSICCLSFFLFPFFSLYFPFLSPQTRAEIFSKKIWIIVTTLSSHESTRYRVTKYNNKMRWKVFGLTRKKRVFFFIKYNHLISVRKMDWTCIFYGFVSHAAIGKKNLSRWKIYRVSETTGHVSNAQKITTLAT